MTNKFNTYNRLENNDKFNRLIDSYESLDEKDKLVIDRFVNAIHCGFKENCSGMKHTHPFSKNSALEIVGELVSKDYLP